MNIGRKEREGSGDKFGFVCNPKFSCFLLYPLILSFPKVDHLHCNHVLDMFSLNEKYFLDW